MFTKGFTKIAIERMDPVKAAAFSKGLNAGGGLSFSQMVQNVKNAFTAPAPTLPVRNVGKM